MPPPGCQSAAPYRALVNSRFLRQPFFLLATFFAAPWRIFAAPTYSFVCQQLLSRTVLCTYEIFFDRWPLLSLAVLCSYIIFWPLIVIKLDMNLPIFQQIFKMLPPHECPPPASGVCGAAHACYATY